MKGDEVSAGDPKSTLEKWAKLETLLRACMYCAIVIAALTVGYLFYRIWEHSSQVRMRTLPATGTISIGAVGNNTVYRVSERTPLIPEDIPGVDWSIVEDPRPRYLSPGDMVWVLDQQAYLPYKKTTGRKRYMVVVTDGRANYVAWGDAEDLEGQTLEEVPQ